MTLLSLIYNPSVARKPPAWVCPRASDPQCELREFEALNLGSTAVLQGNNPNLCGAPLGSCRESSGLGSGGIAGIVISLMASIVVIASLLIGFVQGKKRKNRGR